VADNFLVRGIRFNQGVLQNYMIDAEADKIDDPAQSKCVAIDARVPLYEGGIRIRLDCMSLGVVLTHDVNASNTRAKLSGEALCDLGTARPAAVRSDRLFGN
jgi:hypothetical protein